MITVKFSGEWREVLELLEQNITVDILGSSGFSGRRDGITVWKMPLVGKTVEFYHEKDAIIFMLKWL